MKWPLAVLVAAAFAHYFLLHIVALGPTLRRLRHGHVVWLVGVALRACSLFGAVALLRGVFARPGNRVGWTTSAEIALAGATTKLVAAAGAGGLAVTARQRFPRASRRPPRGSRSTDTA